jgi:membrane-associated phospholipid phosphatase
MNRRSQAVLQVFVLGALLTGGPSWSQERDDAASDPGGQSLLGDRSRYFQDFKGFMTAPADWTRREWTQLGAVLATTAVVYQYDYDIRDHFVKQPNPPKDYHDVEDVIPTALIFGATWMAARRQDDALRFNEATTMVRAAALSTVTSLVFKLGLGRERPGQGAPRDGWYNAGRSMPSGHTALGFAVGTVLAESGNPKRRWVRRLLGYGLGVGTAYLRLEHDSHWASDTIPGAALGIAAAKYTMSHDDPSAKRVDILVTPMDGGARLTFSFDLY